MPDLADLDLPNAQWLIAAKVAPVNQSAPLIARQALEFFLSTALVRTLTLVEAPGGYGKSTLLAQWREVLKAQGHVAGWLFLDEDDNSPVILLTYIIFALARAGLPVTAGLRELLANLPNLSPKIAVGMLLNHLAEVKSKVLLILDDFELLDDAVIAQVIQPLIHLAPPNFHILVATRKRPRLNQPQLKAQGRLQEIRVAELRFNISEIEEVFQRQLSKPDIGRVSELTQGWPVALQLLRSWISQDPGRVASLAGMSGLTDEIVEYLSEQVVQAFPEPIRRLLMEAAALHHLSAEDIAEICGPAAGWQALLGCEALRPFLLPHQGSDGIYRLHPILREYLLLELAREAPERKRELHRRAARLYADTGRLLPAIRQADQADDLELEARIIETAGGVQIWLRQGLAITRSINRLLVPELLKRSPRLSLLRALVLLKEGRLAEARALFAELKARTQDFTIDRPGGDAAALRRDALMVESTLMVNDCRAVNDAFLASYESSLAEGHHQPGGFYAGHVKTLLCLAYHQRGYFEKARHHAREALDHYNREEVWHGTVFLHLHLGAIAFAQGRPEAAAASYLEAKTVTQRHFSTDRSKPLLIHPLMAELHYERNELTAARYHSANAVGRLQTTEAWIDIYASACLTAASIASIDKGIEGAMGVISRAQQDAEMRGLTGLETFLRAAEILFLARAGLLARAEALAKATEWRLEEWLTPEVSNTPWREQELAFLARAALALRSGRAEAAAAELAPVTPLFRQAGNLRSYIRLASLQAAALFRSGEEVAAFTLLTDVLSHCRETGYTRIFHDERDLAGECLAAFIRQAPRARARADAGLRRFAAALVRDLAETPDQPLRTNLTPRELTVLGQLGQGHQDKVIARHLNMTENTVKYHLKSIYAKLQVSSRTEAVTEARRRSLIP